MSQNNRQYYEDLARQIEREDNLINTRMTWLLTLQGFLFTALALIMKVDDGGLYFLLMVLLPLTGVILSVFGFYGVWGANIALKELKEIWYERYEKNGNPEKEKFIRPFGNNVASKKGGVPSFYLPIILAVVWLLILGFNIYRLILSL